MKVENEGVHCKKYNGHCMKQWVKILKATWTSPILKTKSTCRTTSSRASLMKDDVKDEVSNGTPKTWIPSNGVVNWDGVLKYGGKLQGDHFLSWIKRPITQNSVWKCSYANDIIEGGPTMWVSSTIYGNR